MALTLAVVDNANGTGAVATVAGTVGGELVTLYRFAFTGDMASMAAVSSGTRNGDGTIAVSITTPAHYLWLAVGATSGNSPIVYQNVTDATEATHKRIADAVKTRIASLGFAWLLDAKIFVRWMVGKQSIKIDGVPSCYVCPVGTENYDNKVINRDDIGYPVAVLLVDALQNDTTRNLNRSLLWRQRVAKSLRSQRLAAVPEVFLAEIIPDVICDPNAYASNALVSAMVFRFKIREGRGL